MLMDVIRNRSWSLAVALIAMHGFGCFVVDAAQPIVRRLEPLGVVRGQATKVTLTGERLGDASSVLLDQNGFTITDIKAIDANKIEMMVTANPDLAPGLYPFQLVTRPVSAIASDGCRCVASGSRSRAEQRL